MDPITLAIIAALATSGTIGTAAGAIALYRAIERAGFPKTTPSGKPIMYERLPPEEIAIQMARRVVITHTLITVGHDRTGQKAVGERIIGHRKVGERKVGERVVSHRVVGHRKVGERQIGEEQVGERTVGYRWKESRIPADRVRLRAIRGLEEYHRRLPAELLLPPDMQELRILTGEAQVLAFERRLPIIKPIMVPIMEDMTEPVTEPVVEPVMEDVMEPVTETIWEPVYEPVTRKKTHGVYMLIDYSQSARVGLIGSIGRYSRPGHPWRGKLSDQATVETLKRCEQEGIPFYCRAFHSEALRLFTWRPGDPPGNVMAYLNGCRHGGTEIAVAIETAIGDLTGEGLDSADLMLHTDGEDNLDESLRRRLDQANVRLHVQLYGVENETLRRLAHTWSLCPTNRYLSQVVTNS